MHKIAVIGAGTMGNGIAHVFAQNGFQVSLIDLQKQQLEKAIAAISKNLDRQVQKGLIPDNEKGRILNRIRSIEHIEEGIRETDLVIEAATENEPVKLQIFRELDEKAPPEAILAS